MTRPVANARIPIGISGLRFNGASSYVSIGTMGSFGSSLGSGFYCAFSLSTLTTTQDVITGVFNTGSTMALLIQLNTDQNSALAANKIKIFLRDNSGNNIQCASTSAVVINDGLKHTIVVSATNHVVTLTIDGNNVPITYANQGTLSSYANFTFSVAFGAENFRGTIAALFNGIIYNFKIGTSSGALLGNYVLNESSGQTVADSSGNSNTGTVILTDFLNVARITVT